MSEENSHAMHDVSGLCVIKVNSTWQSGKKGHTVAIQTAHESTIEAEAQTTAAAAEQGEEHRNDANVGTDDRGGVPSAQPAGSGWEYQNDPSDPHYDLQEVAEFLAGVHKDLGEDLKQMTKSSAFDGYEPGWKEKSKVGARLLQTFPNPSFFDDATSAAASLGPASPITTGAGGGQQRQQPQQQQQALPVQVTGVSWNAAGALVATSYGRVDSYTWSTGNGFVAIWPATGSSASYHNNHSDPSGKAGSSSADSPTKRSSKRSGKSPVSSSSGAAAGGDSSSATAAASSASSADRPLILLETDAFATSVAFHPVVPTLVAAATFSGEILLWDISSTDDASASSVKPLCSNFGGADRGGHHGHQQHAGAASSSASSATAKAQDPINKLVWIQNPREPRESHRYVLCSGSSDGAISLWTPTNKFAEPIAFGTLQNRRRNALGVQSIAFLSTAGMGRKIPTQEAPMVVATDSGDVVRGKVPPRPAGSNIAKATPLNDTEFFESHSGPANAIDASPFFRNVYLTCSSDGSVRLYSLLDMQHKLALVPSPDTKHFLYGAAWSPIRPGVIATCSRSSQVHLYDLAHSRVKPAFTIDHAGSEDSAVLCLSWSSHGSSFATGDSKGCVRIWSVASALCETTELERVAMRYADRSAGGGGSDLSASRSVRRESTSVNENSSGGGALALTQSMMIDGRGAAGGEDGGSSTNPIQLLLGFAP